MSHTNLKTVSLLGSANIGRTNLLRIFIKLVEEGKIEGKIIKADFSGETTLVPGDRETKTIHPNKVIYETKQHIPITIFAPGGETDRPVVKIGAINSSRLAKAIVAVFDMTQDLLLQLQYFTKLKIFVKSLWVCLTKFDLVPRGEQANRIKVYEQQIKTFFAQRSIEVKNIAWAGESMSDDYEKENIAAAYLILAAAENK